MTKNVETEMQPVRREFLFEPRITLYITNLELAHAFRSPRYAVVLGRSQDLFTYTRVTVIDLLPAERAYAEKTLLPVGTGRWASRGVAVAMPRFINYAHNRSVAFGQYQMVRSRIRLDEESGFEHQAFLVDPESDIHDGRHRAVVFHGFVDTAQGEGDEF